MPTFRVQNPFRNRQMEKDKGTPKETIGTVQQTPILKLDKYSIIQININHQ
jgi:hypothetical protein